MGRFFLTTLLQQIADMVGYAKIHTETGLAPCPRVFLPSSRSPPRPVPWIHNNTHTPIGFFEGAVDRYTYIHRSKAPYTADHSRTTTQRQHPRYYVRSLQPLLLIPPRRLGGGARVPLQGRFPRVCLLPRSELELPVAPHSQPPPRSAGDSSVPSFEPLLARRVRQLES